MKIKFLLTGLINVLITNILLQILLLLKVVPIIYSTLISTIFNILFGYCIYSRLIFKIKNNIDLNYIIKYSIMILFAWIILNSGIYLGILIGISPNISSLFFIPILGIYSYCTQKFWVFK